MVTEVANDTVEEPDSIQIDGTVRDEAVEEYVAFPILDGLVDFLTITEVVGSGAVFHEETNEESFVVWKLVPLPSVDGTADK